MSTRALWERGSPLTDADFRFATQVLRDEHNAMITAFNSTVAKAAKNRGTADSFTSLTDALSAFVEPSKVRHKMQDQLLDWLASRHLIAYGFLVPRHPS